MDINIFNIIISLIIILISYILISLVIKFLLKIFNNYEYKNYYLLLPTFFSMGSFSLGFLIWYYIITYIFNIDIIEVIIDTGGIPFSPRVKSDDGKRTIYT